MRSSPASRGSVTRRWCQQRRFRRIRCPGGVGRVARRPRSRWNRRRSKGVTIAVSTLPNGASGRCSMRGKSTTGPPITLGSHGWKPWLHEPTRQGCQTSLDSSRTCSSGHARYPSSSTSGPSGAAHARPSHRCSNAMTAEAAWRRLRPREGRCRCQPGARHSSSCVQSIPTVVAIKNGIEVDRFTGCLARSRQILAFLDQACCPRSSMPWSTRPARRSSTATTAGAEHILRQVLEQQAGSPGCRHEPRRTPHRPRRHRRGPHRPGQSLVPDCRCRAPAGRSTPAPGRRATTSRGLEAAANADPRRRLTPRLALASALAGHSEFEPALDRLLDVGRSGRARARKMPVQAMVDIFGVLGNEHPTHGHLPPPARHSPVLVRFEASGRRHRTVTGWTEESAHGHGLMSVSDVR